MALWRVNLQPPPSLTHPSPAPPAARLGGGLVALQRSTIHLGHGKRNLYSEMPAIASPPARRSNDRGANKRYVVLLRSSSSSNRSGSRRDEEEEEEDEDMMTLLEKKVVIHAYPLSERRREEEEAMRKSKEILFGEFCRHLGLAPEEVRAIWYHSGSVGGGGGGGVEGPAEAETEVGMGEEETRLQGWVREFLAEWGWRYHPLSPTSAMDMLNDHIATTSRRFPHLPTAVRQ